MMHISSLQFEISQLRSQKTLMAVEAIMVFVAALFVSAFLPTLLIRYVYASQNLLEAPKVLEYIPVVTYVVGMGFFIYAVIRNLMMMKRIGQLEAELRDAEMNCDCDCGACGSDLTDLKELDELAAKMVASNKKKKTTKKSTARKSSKK